MLSRSFPLPRMIQRSRSSLFTSLRSYTTQSNECSLEFLKDDAHKGVAVLRLNRPKAKNALGKNMIQQMRDCLHRARFESTDQCRVLLIVSDVQGAFCAGADLKERAQMNPQETAAFVHQLRSTFSDIENLPMPTIACINGAALGGGLEMALACDMRVAEEGRKVLIGLPETGLAIIPGAGGTQRLPRIIGLARAKELIYTARKLSATEAEKFGLVNYAVEEGKSYEKALEIAKEIVVNGPIAVRVAKIAVQEGMQMDRNSGMILEQQCYAQIIPTEDRLEALQAFREKRKPEFKGE